MTSPTTDLLHAGRPFLDSTSSDTAAYAAPADAEQRGRTTVRDRVVEKIAAQSVTEVDCATGAVRRVLGVGLGATERNTPARVDAQVDGNLVTVDVSMSVVWPGSVREVTRQVRHHVIRRVHELTGLHVAEVNINVPTLLIADADTGGRVH